MSDSPRWHLDGLPGTTGIVEVMLYDDHVAAVAAARADEREKWEPMVQALTDELLAKPPNMSMGAQYLAGVVAGVQAAREAVAALAPTWAVKFYVNRPSNGEWIGCNGAHEEVDVLAAIDALTTRGKGRS